MKTRNNSTKINLQILSALLVMVGLGNAQADNGPQHRVPQLRPVALGTSGGNIADRSRRYCCSGTLGALVQDAAGKKYILSNNHVLARGNQAALGEDINQPGMIDQNCSQQGAVADLSSFVRIQFWSGKKRPLNYVDAAIAAIRPADASNPNGYVQADGTILDIGTVSSETVAPSAGLVVAKSGRTTGYTAGVIAAVGVTVNVAYSQTCGGANNLTATFSDQIRIDGAGFSAGGDSGSLIVELAPGGADGRPRAVGLLFAGGATSTFANRIGNVLTGLGVTMVGGTTTTASGVTVGGADFLATAKAAKERHSQALLDTPGVHGHGVGHSPGGQPVIEVYVEDEPAKGRVPSQLDGVPVRVIVTGPIVAF
ncbi:MAG: hypothetical protein HZA90_10110 [Verrucomicrobia bacterium]|nr:hypothetical protein [Verrucomicrobiota bacterium]